MPNWVFNGLTVEGSPSSVQKLKEQMNKPITREYDNWDSESMSMKRTIEVLNNPIFSFWNIIAPTDMAEYIKQPNWVKDDISDERRSKTGLDWYNWNCAHWGVKWDVAVADNYEYSDTELQDEQTNGENTVLLYRFNTAWGTPDNALLELSRQFPDLLLTNEFEEEQGWGGEAEYLRGIMTELSGYNWKCQNCGYMESDEPPYCEECEASVCPECLYADVPTADLCKEHNGSQRP